MKGRNCGTKGRREVGKDICRADTSREKGGRRGDLRGEQSHICPSYDRICDLGVEGRDGDEHDRAGEGGEDVGCDHCEQVPGLHSVRGEDHDHSLRDHRCDQSGDERPTPYMDGRVGCRPPSGVVTEADLKGEVNEDCQGDVLGAETLFEEFEVGDGVVGLEADLGDQVHDDDALNVAKFEDVEHRSVYGQDPVTIFGFLFSFHYRESDCHKQVRPSPE